MAVARRLLLIAIVFPVRPGAFFDRAAAKAEAAVATASTWTQVSRPDRGSAAGPLAHRPGQPKSQSSTAR